MEYIVTVHFSVGGTHTVLKTASSEEAIAEARRYLGADAQGVWIQTPDGRKVKITPSIARDW